VPYEFSGLYLFGTPLPMVDDEVVVSPAQKAALKRAVAEMMMATADEPKPAPDATAS
jgi:hypothetical protein